MRARRWNATSPRAPPRAACSTASQKLFDLPERPERIEVYDNSHIMGTNAYGAMIVGGPNGFNKGGYRKFSIKSALTPGDDFAMMREVLDRRFGRALKEDPARAEPGWPDLVVIDGGQGQLTAAREIMAGLGLDDIPLVAIAKGVDRDAGREWFHMAGREAFQLPPRDPVLYYLQRLRDEAHRFAINTHRAGRAKALTRSELDDVPGVGPQGEARAAEPLRIGPRRAQCGRAGPGPMPRRRPRAGPPDSPAFPPWLRASYIGAVPTDLPNLLTLSRIVAIPLLVLLVAIRTPWFDFAASMLFSAAAITDYFDGKIARDRKIVSDFGRMLDPIADKLLVGAALMLLAGFERLPHWALLPAIVIMLREILVSGLREYLAGLNVGLPVTSLAKWKTGFQMGALGTLLAGDSGARMVGLGLSSRIADRRDHAVDCSRAHARDGLGLLGGRAYIMSSRDAPPLESTKRP
jgi:CDP-diacylglycerol--glycerol-3-phosphate 3-phosphatidyltransferase